MPGPLRSRVEGAAAKNGRSLNAEILDRLQHSFEPIATNLGDLPDGVLLHEVIARYGARLQIIVASDKAEAMGIDPLPTWSKNPR